MGTIGIRGTSRGSLILLGDYLHILEVLSIVIDPSVSAPVGSASQQFAEIMLSRFFSRRKTAVRQMEIITYHAQNSAKQLGEN